MMRQLIGAAVLGTTLLSGTALAGGNIPLTGKNTTIEFVGTKPNGKHEGGFKEVNGTAQASGADPTTLKFTVEIDTTSIYTDTPKLTQHLMSPDFFDVKTNPKAKFVSSKIEKSADGYTVTGELTLCGKTKAISFPARITLSDGGLNLTSQFQIDRRDFGMTYGAGKINDQIALKVSVNAKK
jgi:polyisoprenoid-binding protein YceI